MTGGTRSIDVVVRYVGGPTTIVEIDGVRFITDPTFDDAGHDLSIGPRGHADQDQGPGNRARRHRWHRCCAGEPRAAPGQSGYVWPRVAEPDPLGSDRAGERGEDPGAVGLAPGAGHDIAATERNTLRVTATPARHGPHGAEGFAGEVIGFVIQVVDTGEALVYVTGDTVWFDGVRGVAKTFQPRVVILHGGAATTSRSVFQLTMNANDAVELATAFPDATIVPVHHDGWTHFVQTQDDLAHAFKVLGLDRLQLVEAGGSYTFSG